MQRTCLHFAIAQSGAQLENLPEIGPRSKFLVSQSRFPSAAIAAHAASAHNLLQYCALQQKAATRLGGSNFR
jgi:hypothetical protein